MNKSIFLLSILLCGCAFQRQEEARIAQSDSLTQYKNCLLAHSKKPAACESQRLIYDADRNNYEMISSHLDRAFGTLGESRNNNSYNSEAAREVDDFDSKVFQQRIETEQRRQGAILEDIEQQKRLDRLR